MESLDKQIDEYISKDGIMENHIAGFRCREEQERLAKAVAKAFEEDEFLIAEAGTGIGKTYAYLLPAIIWAKKNNEKVAISTKTKALQEQIVKRDIVILQKVLNFKFTYAEGKGRENYLCWRKYEKILKGRKKLTLSEQRFIEAILNWAESTSSGDKAELSIPSNMLNTWYIVASHRSECDNHRCEFQEKCFRLKMLRNLERADLMVINHSLLLSNALMEKGILPDFEYLIIDEAHALSREAFDKFSQRISHFDFKEILKGSEIQDFSSKAEKPTEEQVNLPASNFEDYNNLKNALQKIITSFTSFFHILDKDFAPIKEDYNTRLLSEKEQEEKWFKKLFEEYLLLQDLLKISMKNIEQLIAKEEIKEEEKHELKLLLSKIINLSDLFFNIIEENADLENIRWVNYQNNKAVDICSAPLGFNELLKKHLYSKMNSMVMLSASLSVENKFDYAIKQLLLEDYQKEGRLRTLLEKSPFNYKEQSALYIPLDIPEPSNPDYDAELLIFLEKIILKLKRRILVLFTSKKQLKQASRYLRSVCENENINLLVQSENGEHSKIINEFLKDENSVLMGLDTFWEGIDLKGDALQCVIIVKLPFRSPDDPYTLVWKKYYELNKQNSFKEFLLPDAALRFKQGIGRLIRSEEDRGVAIVLDKRLAEKNYKKVFIASIPEQNIYYANKNQLIDLVNEELK